MDSLEQPFAKLLHQVPQPSDFTLPYFLGNGVALGHSCPPAMFDDDIGKKRSCYAFAHRKKLTYIPHDHLHSWFRPWKISIQSPLRKWKKDETNRNMLQEKTEYPGLKCVHPKNQWFGASKNTSRWFNPVRSQWFGVWMPHFWTNLIPFSSLWLVLYQRLPPFHPMLKHSCRLKSWNWLRRTAQVFCTIPN